MNKLLTLVGLLILIWANSEAQVTNPYKQFGYQPKNQYVQTKEIRFEIKNDDTLSKVNSLVFDFNKSTVYVIGKSDIVLKEILVSKTDMLRFLSIDPLSSKYPQLTPYQFAGNSPISGVDLDGLEYYFAADGSYLGQSKYGGTQIRVATAYHDIHTQDAHGNNYSQRVFDKWQDIRSSDLTTPSKVYSTIYKREVGGYLKSVTAINNGSESNSASTKAYGVFQINMNNRENGEYLMTDYNNVSATLHHEDKHSLGYKAGTETSDPFSHFDIEKGVTNNKQVYNPTTVNFKSFTNGVMLGYLKNDVMGSQETNIMDMISKAHSDKSWLPSLNTYYQKYVSNVNWFNKTFKANLQVADFSAFEKLLYPKEKSVIPTTK